MRSATRRGGHTASGAAWRRRPQARRSSGTPSSTPTSCMARGSACIVSSHSFVRNAWFGCPTRPPTSNVCPFKVTRASGRTERTSSCPVTRSVNPTQAAFGPRRHVRRTRPFSNASSRPSALRPARATNGAGSSRKSTLATAAGPRTGSSTGAVTSVPPLQAGRACRGGAHTRSTDTAVAQSRGARTKGGRVGACSMRGDGVRRDRRVPCPPVRYRPQRRCSQRMNQKIR
jgi:hypothetical protein